MLLEKLTNSQSVSQPPMGVGPTDREVEGSTLSKEMRERIEAAEVKLDTTFPEERYLLSKEGVELLSIGDLAFVKGKQKQGKTMALKVIVAALLGDETFGFRTLIEGLRVCYIDTEQNARDTQVFLTTIKEMVPEEEAVSRQLKVFNLRELLPKEQNEVMRGILELHKPDVLVIDNLLDLVPKFMDQESYQGIKDIMALSTKYHCCIISVMHTNKSTFDDNMPGMCGTAAARKAEIVLMCTLNEGTVLVETTDSRHAPVPDWGFRIGEDGAIEPLGTEALRRLRRSQMSRNEERIPRALDIAREMAGEGGQVERKQLKERLKTEFQIGETTAKQVIKQMVSEHHLTEEGQRGTLLRLNDTARE